MASLLFYLTTLLGTLLISAVSSMSFEQWMKQEHKVYSSLKEQTYRQSVFEENQKFINQWNQENHTSTVGYTPFADMTNQEFRQFLRKSNPIPRLPLPSHSTLSSSSSLTELPSSVDWQSKGFVSSVKNVQCSAVVDEISGAVESAAAISYGKLRLVNESQLSCAGCGCTCQVFDVCPYITKHGMTFNYQPGNCKYTPDIQVKTCKNIQANNETALLEALASQPVMVGVEADTPAFQLYTGGVLTDSSCGTNVDHVLLAVGYGTDNGLDYFRNRNSWGPSWGENGYIRIGRGSNKYPPEGECGILSYNIMPIVSLN